MSDVKWIKLQTDIFDNRKIKQLERLPDGDSLIVIWLKILVLAGATNDNGMIYFTPEIPYTDQLLATEFNRPLSTVQFALQTFERFGMIEIINEIIHVSNWERYQNVEGLEKVREQTRKRVAAYRERQKDNLLNGATVCAYCGGEGETVDHVIPKSKGGLDIPENAVPCCLACNMEKTNRDVAVFLNDRLLMGKPVDVNAIVNNKVLKKYISFDYQQNRFVTLQVTQSNATDKEEEKEIDKESELDSKRKRFTAPTIDEVRAYCKERGNSVDPAHFIAHYEANGWKVGRNQMKDWKAAVRTWEKNEYGKRSPKYASSGQQKPLGANEWEELMNKI